MSMKEKALQIKQDFDDVYSEGLTAGAHNGRLDIINPYRQSNTQDGSPEWYNWGSRIIANEKTARTNRQYVYMTLLEKIDLSYVKDFSNMFEACSDLTYGPAIDTGNGEYFKKMFLNCLSMADAATYDLSNAVDITEMFYMCQSIGYIKIKNTNKVKNFRRAFGYCKKAKHINTNDVLDTSNGENFSDMFNNCIAMVQYPEMDTSKGTNFVSMFGLYGSGYEITELATIPKINISNATSVTNMFYAQDGGKFKSITFEGSININGLNVSQHPDLNHESLMSIINALADKTSDTSGTVWKVTLGSANLSKLTDDEKVLATNKGWQLA